MKENQDKQSWFKRHKAATVVIVVILVLVAIGSLSTPEPKHDGGKSDKNPDRSSQTGDKQPALKIIGETVRDGKFEFTVTKVNCGEAVVGDQYLSKKAQGQFCRVSITVKNIGDQSQTLSHTDQFVYNDKKQKYTADSEAAIYGSDSADGSWYSNINPGNTVSGDLFFDMPKDVAPYTIELHDSALSGGVEVKLKDL